MVRPPYSPHVRLRAADPSSTAWSGSRRSWATQNKGDFVHHTLKEIHDQPDVITKAGGRAQEQNWRPRQDDKGGQVVYITGSGSSYNAALVGKHLFSKHAGIRTEPIISSEAQFSPMYLDQHSLLLALSQSGESADVLDAATIAKGARVDGRLHRERRDLVAVTALRDLRRPGLRTRDRGRGDQELHVPARRPLRAGRALHGGKEFDLQSLPAEMQRSWRTTSRYGGSPKS